MPTPTELRDQLHQLVLADLLGPANGPDEIVELSDIRSRYLVGMLAPKGQLALPEDQEWEDAPATGVDGEDGAADVQPPKLGASMLPSSIGLSFVVDGAATALQITARWGWYTRIKNPKPPPAEGARQLETVWQRQPVAAVSPPIPLAPGRIAPWSPAPDRRNVYVDGLVRARGDQWHVTLFLVNGQEETEKNVGSVWLFQPQLSVAAPDGAPIFEKRPAPNRQDDPELAALSMRYRRRVEFAVGHGVAVRAELAPGYVERAVRLHTEIAPSFDMPVAEPPTAAEEPLLAGLDFDMRSLAATPDGGFTAHLAPLADAYGAWIERIQQRVVDLEPELQPHRDAAQQAVADCGQTLARIRAGIALLDRDPQAAAAFRFANRAMADQRVHSLYAREVRQGRTADLAAIEAEPTNHSWRAFQIAFLLLNLCGVTDPTHADRTDLADLLFFPTGGGKTEAYLGLAAYVMALRRLQGVVAGRSGLAGVAVIMRYTLRLLTLQQFQRASALICACELIRREDPARWGTEPFRIGLWVGAKTTPNDTDTADKVIKAIRTGGQTGGAGTPHQLTNCPWCGSPLKAGSDIEVETYDAGRGRTLVYCSSPLNGCPFTRRNAPGEGLPVLTVDEEIYRRLPALLIATVDKFAQMPWNGRTAMLFGRVNGCCERHGYRSPDVEDSDSHPAKRHLNLPAARTVALTPLRPPDLIIQDELHLISGPLGSLVGLYETVVDDLCTWEVAGKIVRPKVIASTATIRQARTQVHSLFMRQLNVFPAQGLDAGDNFFAREQPTTVAPGRRYVGICAPGIRHRTTLIRVYTTLLAAAQRIYQEHGSACDPWMTLVGYFNALRELGAMRRAVDDSVTARLQRTERLGLAKRLLSPWSVQELTSRLDATDIPDLLDQLEVGFDPAQETARRQKKSAGRRPLDVLLATNMISVGVDVSRLGLMVVAGQPKNTAEYIQSTSRVGRSRSGPGLVFVVYNWTRPRDLSHYETFEHYHATAYQHVEALSVTPFSAGAVSRGLSGVLTAGIRLLGMDLNRNEDAGHFAKSHPFVAQTLAAIVRRADEIEGHAVAQHVEASVKTRLDTWADKVAHTVGATLVYKKQTGTQSGLLHKPEGGDWQLFTCLNSLRDVEPTAKLILNDAGMDHSSGRPWSFVALPTTSEAAPVTPEATDEA